jgi:hypothetical protein
MHVIPRELFSFVINGQPFANLRGDKGIRQRCPLSPYLFVLAVNELSIALQEAVSTNSFAGITLMTKLSLYPFFFIFR